MKKLIIGFSVVMALVASVAVFAGTHDDGCGRHNHETVDLHMEGKHCSGTVGCSCPGFKPITNQEVWKQSYCKNCGHHKNCHR